MTEDLRKSELVAVIDATRLCSEAQDKGRFAQAASAGLRSLVPCDHASYNVVDPGLGSGLAVWARVNPPDAAATFPAEGGEVVSRYGTQSPFMDRPHGPDEPPLTWWDLDPGREMCKGELWDLLYRPMGVATQLGASLREVGPRIEGLAASRLTGDFSDHDRAVMHLYRLQLLGPKRLVELSSTLAQAQPAAQLATIVLDHDGRVLSVNGTAKEVHDGVLEKGDGPPRLSEPVAAWVAAQRKGGATRSDDASQQDSVPPGWRPLVGRCWARLLTGPLEDLLVLRPGRDTDNPAAGQGPKVRALGGFSAVVDGTEVELTGRPAEVVKLVVALGGQAGVDVVIEALWPDVAPDLGRERLRTVLARVPHCRQRLLVRRGDTLALAPGVLVDATDFETAARRALTAKARGDRCWVTMAGEALDSYGGDLFAGRTDELWALGPRERLRRRHLALLDALAREAASTGDWSRSLVLLDEAIECDPADESRYLLAAQVLASQGRHAAALGLLSRARSVLMDLGLPVPTELKALEASLRA